MFMRNQNGFTLIELMIVVAIVAILATIAYVSYGNYVFRAHRADGREMLMRVAAAQERYLTNYNAYAPSVTAAPNAGLGFSTDDSEKGYYKVAVAITDGGLGYVLAATPQGAQTPDVCGPLTITNTGLKAPTDAAHSTNGACW